MNASIASIALLLVFALVGCASQDEAAPDERFELPVSDELASRTNIELPATSVRDNDVTSYSSPEETAGGPYTHHWHIEGYVVKAIPSVPCVIIEVDAEDASILEPGLVTVILDGAVMVQGPVVAPLDWPTLVPGTQIKASYMLPLQDSGFVVANRIEVL